MRMHCTDYNMNKYANDNNSPEDWVNWNAHIVKVSTLLGTLEWKDILVMDGRHSSSFCVALLVSSFLSFPCCPVSPSPQPGDGSSLS